MALGAQIPASTPLEWPKLYMTLRIVRSSFWVPAGFSAAVYAAGQPQTRADHRRRARRPAHDHHRGATIGPGDAHGLLGPALMERMKAHAGASREDRQRSHPHGGFLEAAVHADRATTATTPATRSSSPPAPRPSISAFRPRKSSAARVSRPAPPAMGFFYKGPPCASSWAAATRRSKKRSISPTLASHVTVVHRRDKFRAEKILQDRLFALREDRQECASPGITPSTKIVGDDSGVNGVHIKPHGARRHHRNPGRDRRIHRHRPHAEHRHLRRPASEMRDGLHHHPERQRRRRDRHQRARGIRRWRASPDHVYRQAITSAGSDAWLRSMRTSTSTSITDIDPAAWDALERGRLALLCVMRSWRRSKTHGCVGAGTGWHPAPITPLHDDTRPGGRRPPT